MLGVCKMQNNQDFHTVRGYEILEKGEKRLTHSMEDYLEMIFRNSRQEGYTRINILAESLNVQAPSATKMVQKLASSGLLKYRKYGIIKLTKEGEEMGSFLLKRHRIIEDFLKLIGVERNILLNAELVEHNVTTDALYKIEILNAFLMSDPDILNRFAAFRKTYGAPDDPEGSPE